MAWKRGVVSASRVGREGIVRVAGDYYGVVLEFSSGALQNVLNRELLRSVVTNFGWIQVVEYAQDRFGSSRMRRRAAQEDHLLLSPEWLSRVGTSSK